MPPTERVDCPPARGFPTAEFERRLMRLQAMMRDRRLDAVLLTTEPNVRYFSGFHSQFWHSPTRPWFLILPADGKPIAVIPEIGASGMAATWVDEIETWPSPRPQDDGVSLLVSRLRALPGRFARIGMTLGAESHLRMPIQNFTRLQQALRRFEFVDVAAQIQQQRMLKSALEIDKIRYICQLASDAFHHLPGYARVGMRESEICRQMKIDLLRRGADTVAYLVAGSGAGGYDSIIMGPTERALCAGDLLMIDTGSVYDGYFCDFDRNWAFGQADRAAIAAYDAVWRATEAGFNCARPGATTSDLWQAMNAIMAAAGSLGNATGRLGHGLGIELTERPSNTSTDQSALQPGMVMTLEPGMEFAPGKQMVHEENIVITEDGAEWLSTRADPQLPLIG